MTKAIEIGGILILLWAISPCSARAERIQERFSFGGYASTERFTNDLGGSDSNDFAILSGRAFLKVDDWGSDHYELIADVRDKDDFFDKLDAERLKLDPVNDLQLRQLSLRQANPTGNIGWTLGRFPLPEAGAVFVDGAQAEVHWTPALRTGIFGGYNPKQEFQSYVQWDSHANIYGANLTYQGQSLPWNKNLYITSALVSETYDQHTDRSYFFNSSIVQWSVDSRLISLLYVDFVPHTFVQTGDLIWQQGWSRYFSTQAEALGIDVIEYARRQGVLETLPSSPYKEGSLTFNVLGTSSTKTYLRTIYGRRELDGYQRTEADLGWTKTGLFSGKWDVQAMAGVRDNFTSHDVLSHGEVGYFSRKWESALDLDYSVQNNTSGRILHPVTVEWSISEFFSRSVYGTISYQRAWDEDVTINSVFFRVGCNFGNQERAPIRDGAPPRGAL